MLASLMRRGDAMFALGDVSAARRLYERAATAGSGSGSGSGSAATAAGRTFDPAVLAAMQAPPSLADPGAAAGWYRKAILLGDREAEALLARLMAGNQ
jgi:TPR repeat protein